MRVYVGNLSRKTTDKQLNDLATPFGRPESSFIVRSFADNVSRGFGFIDYHRVSEARAAIAGLHGLDVENRILAVREANVPKPTPDCDLLHSRE